MAMKPREDGEKGTGSASHPGGDRLLLFAEGLLDSRESRAVSDHVRSCERCATALELISHMLADLRKAGAPRARVRSRPCPTGDELACYADGTLPREAVAHIESHLSSCAACLAEVADLWAMAGPETEDAKDASVRRVIERLEREPATAVVRLAGRALEIVRGFTEPEAGTGSEAAGGLVPALARAGARPSSETSLRWAHESGAEITGMLQIIRGAPALTGRVTRGGAPMASASVMLTTDQSRHGPESLDSHGYFGPWPLAEGSNILRVTGLPSGSTREVELEIVVSPDAADGETAR